MACTIHICRTLGPCSSKAWHPGQQPLSSWGSGIMVVVLFAALLLLSWSHLLSHSSDLFWLISSPRFYPRLWIHGQTLVCNSGLLLWGLTASLTFPMLALQHLFLTDFSPLPQPPSGFPLFSTRALGVLASPSLALLMKNGWDPICSLAPWGSFRFSLSYICYNDLGLMGFASSLNYLRKHLHFWFQLFPQG